MNKHNILVSVYTIFIRCETFHGLVRPKWLSRYPSLCSSCERKKGARKRRRRAISRTKIHQIQLWDAFLICSFVFSFPVYFSLKVHEWCVCVCVHCNKLINTLSNGVDIVYTILFVTKSCWSSLFDLVWCSLMLKLLYFRIIFFNSASVNLIWIDFYKHNCWMLIICRFNIQFCSISFNSFQKHKIYILFYYIINLMPHVINEQFYVHFFILDADGEIN